MTEFRVDGFDGLRVLMDYNRDSSFQGGNNQRSGGMLVAIDGMRLFRFDLSGRIVAIDGNYDAGNNNWDWLERTLSDEWVYYSMYQDVNPKELIGATWWPINRWADPSFIKTYEAHSSYIDRTFERFDELILKIRNILGKNPNVDIYESESFPGDLDSQRVLDFLERVAEKDREWLAKDGQKLHDIIEGEMGVLSPDTIRVKYQVVPIMVMDGCIYRCRDCGVRGDSRFSVRSEKNVQNQVTGLKGFLGPSIVNYNAVHLGQNDAVAAGMDIIEYAASLAYQGLEIADSCRHGSALFMFSTVRSLLDAPDALLSMLDRLPFEEVYINIGYEAVTEEGLRIYGKPQTRKEVLEGLAKAARINKQEGKVKVSGNFVLGDDYPEEHAHRIRDALVSTGYSGRIYLSPMIGKSSSDRCLSDFEIVRSVKNGTETLMYTMQRL